LSWISPHPHDTHIAISSFPELNFLPRNAPRSQVCGLPHASGGSSPMTRTSRVIPHPLDPHMADHLSATRIGSGCIGGDRTLEPLQYRRPAVYSVLSGDVQSLCAPDAAADSAQVVFSISSAWAIVRSLSDLPSGAPEVVTTATTVLNRGPQTAVLRGVDGLASWSGRARVFPLFPCAPRVERGKPGV
jgi:hypothetical protein